MRTQYIHLHSLSMNKTRLVESSSWTYERCMIDYISNTETDLKASQCWRLSAQDPRPLCTQQYHRLLLVTDFKDGSHLSIHLFVDDAMPRAGCCVDAMMYWVLSLSSESSFQSHSSPMVVGWVMVLVSILCDLDPGWIYLQCITFGYLFFLWSA